MSSAAYLQINPLGGLPTLVGAGHPPIAQSQAILEFAEETQPQPALLPADRHGRAQTRPLITPRVKKYLAGEAGFDEAAWKRWQTPWFGVGLAAVEQRLSTEPQTGLFCHRDQVGMADILLASVVAVMRVFQVEVPDIPTVLRIVARCSALDAFVRAEPARQVGAPV